MAYYRLLASFFTPTPMPLPRFLFENSSRVTLRPAPSAAKLLSEAALATLAYQPLAYQNAIQEQTNWCWAAASLAVARYYTPATPWTQCAIASGELGKPCCANPAICNVYGYLDMSLARVGHLNPSSAPAPASTALLHSEINVQRRPLCLRIAWTGGGAHFVALHGVDSTSPTAQVYVADPWFGDSVRSYGLFPSTYNGGGTWTHSFLTKP